MDDTIRETGTDLRLSRRDGVLRVALNRPNKRNALSSSMIAQLNAVLDNLAGDRQIRVVVLSAAGDVFCAGHDLQELSRASAVEAERLFNACSRMMLRFRQLPQPVIARVQGLATAAGCQLVAASDLAVAAETARFATPGVKIGLFCTTPMVPLVRTIAPRAALEMLLTGEPISARRAFELGLVNRVVPQTQLDDVVSAWTNGLLAASGEVLRLGKAAFYNQLTLSEPDAYRDATEVMARNAALPDAVEGIGAFLEKRPPRWPTNDER